jgi:hypothetical protein
MGRTIGLDQSRVAGEFDHTDAARGLAAAVGLGAEDDIDAGIAKEFGRSVAKPLAELGRSVAKPLAELGRSVAKPLAELGRSVAEPLVELGRSGAKPLVEL